LVAARMTAFSPGQSPPPVEIPIVRTVAMSSCNATKRADATLQIFDSITATQSGPGAYCTVSVMESLTLPRVAVIVVVPAASPVASPALVMVATLVLLEVQVTAVVMSFVVKSAKSPFAANCWVSFTLITGGSLAGLVGVMVMALSAGGSTVRLTLAETPPWLAVMLAEPGETPTATPEALTVAMAVLEEAHVAVVVTSRVPPPVSVPVAVNCCVSATSMVSEAGEMEIEARSASSTKKSSHPNTSRAQSNNATKATVAREFMPASIKLPVTDNHRVALLTRLY